MMVLRNGQQVTFNRNEQGDLVQESEFRAQAGFVLEVKNFLLPLGENDKIIVVASNLGLARQMVLRFMAVQEEAAEGRKVAREAAAEEEQAKRAGLMSSEDILAAFSGTEDLSLETEAANALPRPANESYEIGQRVICVNLPHIGATVRSLDDMGVGLDYDTDDDEERGTYEALYSAIRPMPIH